MNEKDKIIIGLKLKELRLKHKLTLKEVADKIGKTPKTIPTKKWVFLWLELDKDIQKTYKS